MEFRQSHIALCDTDLSRSMNFYSALGFQAAEVFELPAGANTPINTLLELKNVHLVAQFMRHPDRIALELIVFKSPKPAEEHAQRSTALVGFKHLSFYVDDLDSAARALEAAGGKVLWHTRTHFDRGDIDAIFCNDPDGTRIELMQVAKHDHQ